MPNTYTTGMDALRAAFGRSVPAEVENGARIAPIHDAVPGRIRFYVAGLKGAEQLRLRLESHLRTSGLVERAAASTITGTVLVIFPQDRSCVEIVTLVESFVLEFAKQGASPASTYRSEKATARHDTDNSWHVLATAQVLTSLGTTRQGLTPQVAAERLREFGSNILPMVPSRSSSEILLGQFKSLPVALLGVSALLSAGTGGLLDAVVIAAVVLINAAIGFVTESRAERTIAALERNSYRRALLVRSGVPLQVEADAVVPGDVLLLTPGWYVSADARLLEARDLTIDESALTGESLPAEKQVSDSVAASAPLADRVNIVHMGSGVTSGSGVAVVVATGLDTQIGRIQSLVSATRPPQTPMQRQLDQLGRQLVWLSGGICAAIFGIGLLRGFGFLPMLRASISLAVAAVPEGLPTVATTTLALGIRSMRRHNVLVRHLDAIETLGAVQVMCMDKTGTLTLNRMSVLALHAGGRRLNVSDARFSDDARRTIDPLANADIVRLLHVSVLCNETEVTGTAGAYTLNGSATEAALLRLAINAGVSIDEVRQRNPLATLEYRSQNRSYMRTLHETADGKRFIAVKGAPAEVLELCRWQLRDGERHALTDEDRTAILEQNDRMASEALRVLGFAYSLGSQDLESPNGDLTWVGLAGMADPIRDRVTELIDRFHAAGIKTTMVTGDQSATAYAIGKQLKLSGHDRLQVLDSTQLEGFDLDAISSLAQTVDVFARVSPAQKLRIVQCLQRAGKVVAMTGDGINDGPALRAANIGVAMGGSGTDIAHSVADVILEDDNLQTMMVAIGEGRASYDNTRKAVHFLVSSNLSEIWLTLAAVAAGAGSPLSPMQLLWINLITDVFPALALAAEPPEPDVLRRPPREPEEGIIRRSDFRRYGIESCALTSGPLAAYVYGRWRYGIGPRAGTLAFMSLGLTQLAHTYSCRSDYHGLFSGERMQRNRYLDVAVAASTVVQLLTAIVPGLRRLLGNAPLGIADFAVTACTAVGPYLVNEGLKAARNTKVHEQKSAG